MSIYDRIEKELEMIPKGEKGSAQNIFRSIYEMVRETNLKDNLTQTRAESFKQALEQMHQNYPDFKPKLINPGYFGLT